MYLIKTLQGHIQADYDEIEKIANSTETLVFLRNGAVNPKHITSIVPDAEERSTVFVKIGETREEWEQRIREYQSKDMFPQVRNNSSLLESADVTFLPY